MDKPELTHPTRVEICHTFQRKLFNLTILCKERFQESPFFCIYDYFHQGESLGPLPEQGEV